jgi:hypothetical protein
MISAEQLLEVKEELRTRTTKCGVVVIAGCRDDSAVHPDEKRFEKAKSKKIQKHE